jgi:hypothetical protein
LCKADVALQAKLYGGPLCRKWTAGRIVDGASAMTSVTCLVRQTASGFSVPTTILVPLQTATRHPPSSCFRPSVLCASSHSMACRNLVLGAVVAGSKVFVYLWGAMVHAISEVFPSTAHIVPSRTDPVTKCRERSRDCAATTTSLEMAVCSAKLGG